MQLAKVVSPGAVNLSLWYTDTVMKGSFTNKICCSHWGQGGLETGDYMLGTFRAHVHLSHNVIGGNILVKY